MNDFVDRRDELEALRKAFEAPGASLFILYGRRRLGKTALLREFASSLPGVYYVADRLTEADNLRFLSAAMAESLREPSLALAEYPDWYALLAAYDRVRPRAKSYLVIDEYQYLAQGQPAISSILQKWWDTGQKHRNMLLVLCGSVTSLMYKETLSSSSPLYGRRTGQWLLEPLRHRDIVRFFPHLDAEELISMWALVGGVPHYARLAGPCGRFETALRELVLSRDGPLFAEAKYLLQEEVSAPNVYGSLLHAIGSGVSRVSELGSRLRLPASHLTRYLTALRELRIVAREVPITEEDPVKSKRGTYHLVDPFLRLWFGCVAPFESLLEFGRIDEARRGMQSRLDGHMAWAFERICRQYVENRSHEIGGVRIGRYWDRNVELDVVAVDEAGRPVLAGECKWSSRPATRDDLLLLQKKVQQIWPEHAARVRLAFFSRSGFDRSARSGSVGRGCWLLGPRDLGSGGV
ncbi:MAG: ATP-binding protein [Candidatus Riflebacteria bacterium]|nr:ATP-binding protein [Candidatus Riflebacteria bacterium]